MSNNILLRGVSACAIAIAFAAPAARAQETLPAINIGTAPASPGAAEPAPAQPGPAPSPKPEPKDSYVVQDTSTATKMDIPNLELPASVSVVPGQAIEDQAADSVKTALENVSSVQPAQTLGSGSFFYVRGFLDKGKIYRDDLISTSTVYFTDLDTSNVERIEVLKGPASVLYGRSEPGGLVNIITKRPVDEPIYRSRRRSASITSMSPDFITTTR